MLTINKYMVLRSSGKRVDYELQIAESIADCLELAGGREDVVVSMFNKIYAATVREQLKPKKPGGQKTLAQMLKTVSPEVQLMLKDHTPEKALELIRQAQEKVELRRREGTVP